MKLNLFLLPLLLLAAFCTPAAEAKAARPNFILFITDDISAGDLGCYGNKKIKTPHLDRMAAEGLRFTNAYLSISSCSPSRCSIISGRWPHNTGACELHTTLPKDQYVFPETLKKAGYYTVLSGKHHMGGAVDRGFDKVSRGKGPGKEGDWVKILKERPRDKPFFFWFASSDAHRGWGFSDDAPTYDPKEVMVPPYLVDGPQTRKDLADYYHEVSRTDHFAGLLRKELKKQKIDGDTYLIYMSDNGRPFPRCKTRLYDDGIKTPFIIACPGRIKPAVTSSLVSSIDISATILELAGAKKDPRVQGVSFSAILRDPEAKTRDFVYAEHNWHVHQAHERLVRWKNWSYIRNAFPERQLLCVEAGPKFPSGKELWEEEAKGRLKAHQRDIFLKPRPPEELYDLAADPHQLNNLASDKRHVSVLSKLRNSLDRWTKETADSVPENPTNDRQDAHGKKYRNHKRGPMPGAELNSTRNNQPGPLRE